MNFAFVAPRFHTNLYYRVLSLQERGHIVKVFVLYKGQSEFYEKINLEKLNLSLFSRLLLNLLKINKKNSTLKSHYEIIFQSPGNSLKKKFIQFKPDVIFLKEFKNLLALRTLLAARASEAKVIIFSQSQTVTIKGSQKLFQYLINIYERMGVKAFITPVRKTYFSLKNIGFQNTFYVPFVYPIQQKRHRIVENNGTIKILSIGKYVKRKDHILLIKVVENLYKKGKKIILDIYGEIGDQELYASLKNYVVNRKLTEIIHLHLNMPYRKMLDEYMLHDLFVLPSYQEPAAYSPVEAMAHGIPVICSSECGTKCYIENGVNGYIFNAHDKNDLENKIELLINNQQLLKKLSYNAYKKAAEIHDIHLFADHIEKILEII